MVLKRSTAKNHWSRANRRIRCMYGVLKLEGFGGGAEAAGNADALSGYR